MNNGCSSCVPLFYFIFFCDPARLSVCLNELMVCKRVYSFVFMCLSYLLSFTSLTCLIIHPSLHATTQFIKSYLGNVIYTRETFPIKSVPVSYSNLWRDSASRCLRAQSASTSRPGWVLFRFGPLGLNRGSP